MIRVSGDTVQVSVRPIVCPVSVTELRHKVSITRGTKGDTGPQGVAGPTGPAGAQGPQGDPGAITNLSDADPLDLGAAADSGIDDDASRADHVHKTPRKLGLICDPRDYGLVEGTVSDGQKALNLAALEDAAAAVMDGIYDEVWIPPGTYQLSDTWHINTPVTIRGSGEHPTAGTILSFPRGVDGVMFDYTGGPVAGGALRARLSDVYVVCPIGPSAWGPGASSQLVDVFIPSNAAGSYQGFCFVCTTGGGSGTVDPFIGFAGDEGDTVTSDQGAIFTARYIAGVKLLTQARVERVRVAGFGGDGFSVFASTGGGTNANGSILNACTATDNVGWGFFTQGADANACAFIACNAFSNGGNYHTYTGSPRDAELKDAYGGFCDNSFVGCSYMACSAEGNRGFGYLVPRNAIVGGQVNESRFWGCYSEGGQINAINQRAGWMYGTTGSENVFGTGNKLAWDWSSPHYFLTDEDGDGGGPTAYLYATRPLSQVSLEMGWSADGNRPTQWSYGNVNGGTTPGWAAMVYNGNLSPFAWSLAGFAGGGGLSWLPSRTFLGPYASEMKPQRLSANMALSIGGVGNTDSLVSHVWNRENGTESLPFATLAAALAYCPKDLNGYTLTITDNRSGAGEAIDTGGFINGTLVLNGARLAACTFRDCGLLQITNAVITGLVTLLRCDAEVAGAISGSGRVLVKRGTANVQLTATSCTGVVLRAEHAQYVGYAVNASSCTGNLVEMFNVQFSELVGAGLVGTNASAPYVVSLSGGGKHVLTGASATSSGDPLDLDGKDVSWSTLSTRNQMRAGTFAFWADNQWTLLGQFLIDNDSSTPYDDLQVSSLQINTYKKEYSADRALPTTDTGAGDYSAGAYAEVIPNAAGTQGAATLVGTQQTLIRANGSTADGHAVRFGDTNEWTGTGFGTHGAIRNGCGFEVKLFPPSGKKIFYQSVDQTADTALLLPAGAFVEWLTDKDGNWWVD